MKQGIKTNVKIPKRKNSKLNKISKMIIKPRRGSTLNGMLRSIEERTVLCLESSERNLCGSRRTVSAPNRVGPHWSKLLIKHVILTFIWTLSKKLHEEKYCLGTICIMANILKGYFRTANRVNWPMYGCMHFIRCTSVLLSTLCKNNRVIVTHYQFIEILAIFSDCNSEYNFSHLIWIKRLTN